MNDILSLDALEELLKVELNHVNNDILVLENEIKPLQKNSVDLIISQAKKVLCEVNSFHKELKDYSSIAEPIYNSVSKIDGDVLSLERINMYVELVILVEDLTKDAQHRETEGKLWIPYLKLFHLYEAIRHTCITQLTQVLYDRLIIIAKRTKEELFILFRSCLTKLSYPQTSKTPLKLESTAVKEFCELCLYLIDVQSSFIQLEKTQNKEENMNGNENINLWLMDLLIEPIEQRFKYHFYGKKSTNRPDKPEWFFTFILDQFDNHKLFLTQGVQYVINQTSLRQSNYNIEIEYMKQLISIINNKLNHIIPKIITIDALYRHLIDEMLIFERQIRTYDEVYIHMPISYEGCIGVFTNNKVYFKAWLASDRTFVNSTLESIRTIKQPWSSYHSEDVEEETMSSTRSGHAFIDLVHRVEERFMYISSIKHRLSFVEGIQMKLYSIYLEDLDWEAKANHDSFTYTLEHHKSPSSEETVDEIWQKECGIINTSLYIRKVMIDWSDKLLYIDLKSDDSKNDDDGNILNSITVRGDISIFDELIHDYGQFETRILNQIINSSYEFFEKNMHTYVRTHEADKKVTNLSVSICSTLVGLKFTLILAETYLSSSLFRAMITSLCVKIDDYMIKSYVNDRYYQDNPNTHYQFEYDILNGLFTVFKAHISERMIEKYFNGLVQVINELNE